MPAHGVISTKLGYGTHKAYAVTLNVAPALIVVTAPPTTVQTVALDG